MKQLQTMIKELQTMAEAGAIRMTESEVLLASMEASIQALEIRMTEWETSLASRQASVQALEIRITELQASQSDLATGIGDFEEWFFTKVYLSVDIFCSDDWDEGHDAGSRNSDN